MGAAFQPKTRPRLSRSRTRPRDRNTGRGMTKGLAMRDDRRMRIRPEPPEPGSTHKAPEPIELTDMGEPTPGDRWVAKDWECWAVGVGDTAIASFQNRADAMLDKAAPDLLAACELALDSMLADCWDNQDRAVVAIRAAIAKARGPEVNTTAAPDCTVEIGTVSGFLAREPKGGAM